MIHGGSFVICRAKCFSIVNVFKRGFTNKPWRVQQNPSITTNTRHYSDSLSFITASQYKSQTCSVMNALSINGNTARHLSISFIKLVSNEWSESCAKLKQSIVCLWKCCKQELLKLKKNPGKTKKKKKKKHTHIQITAWILDFCAALITQNNVCLIFRRGSAKDVGGKGWKWQTGEEQERKIKRENDTVEGGRSWRGEKNEDDRVKIKQEGGNSGKSDGKKQR